LTPSCYSNMLAGCSKINNITMLATDISAKDCLYNWVMYLGNTGTFIKHKDMTSLPIGVHGIPSGWLIQNYGDGLEYYNQYLTFKTIEDSSFRLTQNDCEYSLDEGKTWVSLAAGTNTPTVPAGRTIMFKATNPSITSNSGIGTFSSTGKFNVEGNIMSMLYGDDFVDKNDLTGKDNTFSELFSYCTNLINASDLILPATTLSKSCYASMFRDCSSLTTAPELTATTLANYCYASMFNGCTSLTTAPELPATTLAEGCYNYMFKGCTSLTTTPELPATTLAYGCYESMFSGCKSLVNAPALPATTLAKGCYSYMFKGCTSLTTAPELPATTLTDSCYNCMFKGCSSLNNITMLATNISASRCLENWVDGVANTGTFVKAKGVKITKCISGIPRGWVVQEI
jgi:hypothetical protein